MYTSFLESISSIVAEAVAKYVQQQVAKQESEKGVGVGAEDE